MTVPARGAETLLDLTDQDGNNLRIINAGAGKLLIDVTDENEIPIGILTDRALAMEIRDALTRWIETSEYDSATEAKDAHHAQWQADLETVAGRWEAELRRDAGRSLCIGYCTGCGHSNNHHADRCYATDCTCNRDRNGVSR